MHNLTKIRLKRIEAPFVIEVQNSENLWVNIDASAQIGGKGKGFRPMELLASSLAGCLSIDILLILEKQRQIVTDFEVELIGHRKNETPSPFEEIQLLIYINSEISLEKLNQAVKLSKEKYCSVWATLNPTIELNIVCKHLENDKLQKRNLGNSLAI